MATLTTLTLDANGTIGANVDKQSGDPYYQNCNDDPDSASTDYIENDGSDTATEAWFSLTDVDADFDSMDTLQIRVHGSIVNGAGTATLTARIYDADNDTTNPLTSEITLITTGDGSVLKNVAFGSLTGTKAQWNSAHIRFSWSGLFSFEKARLNGCDFDGTYTAAAGGGQKKIPSIIHSLGDGTGFPFALENR